MANVPLSRLKLGISVNLETKGGVNLINSNKRGYCYNFFQINSTDRCRNTARTLYPLFSVFVHHSDSTKPIYVASNRSSQLKHHGIFFLYSSDHSQITSSSTIPFSWPKSLLTSPEKSQKPLDRLLKTPCQIQPH